VSPEGYDWKRVKETEYRILNALIPFSYHWNRIFLKVFPVPVRTEPEFGKLVPDPVILDSKDKPDFQPDNIFFKSLLFSECVIHLDVKT
jgi:hypothetical protein